MEYKFVIVIRLEAYIHVKYEILSRRIGFRTERVPIPWGMPLKGP